MRQTSLTPAGRSPGELVADLDQSLPASGLYGEIGAADSTSRAPFRLSPRPIGISPATLETIAGLGEHLAAFYRAAGRLYQDSVRGNLPAWPARLLDAGKDDKVVSLARRNRLRGKFPVVIRPDLMLAEDGSVIATELDSVPGGLGVLQSLRAGYLAAGLSTAGAPLAQTLKDALQRQAPGPDPFVAFVVSDESASYRPEMAALASELGRLGLRCALAAPEELNYPGSSVTLEHRGECEQVDVIYRFFELFDLENIPGADQMLAAMQARDVVITPPPRAPLEEKMLLALFHNPGLRNFWQTQLGRERHAILASHLPPTWVVDPTPLPPFAAIDPPLQSGSLKVRRWDELAAATQRQRRLVLKPSGYSPQAWGSRGVTIGHDVPAERWAESLGLALDSFARSPHVLQPYLASRRFEVDWFDLSSNALRRARVRSRFSPYYIDDGQKVTFCGILATACPDSSKILHGMADAVMAPVAVDPQSPL